MATKKHYLTSAFLAAATLLTLHEISGCSKKAPAPAPTLASLPASTGTKPDCNPPSPPPSPPAPPPETKKVGHTGKRPHRTPAVHVAKNKTPQADNAAPEAVVTARPDPVIRDLASPPTANGGGAGPNGQQGSSANLPNDADVRASNIQPNGGGTAVVLYGASVGGFYWEPDGRGGYRKCPTKGPAHGGHGGKRDNPGRGAERAANTYNHINGKIDSRGAKMEAGARQNGSRPAGGAHSAAHFSGGGAHHR